MKEGDQRQAYFADRAKKFTNVSRQLRVSEDVLKVTDGIDVPLTPGEETGIDINYQFVKGMKRIQKSLGQDIKGVLGERR